MGIDAKSYENKSLGVSAMTRVQMKDHYNYAPSINNTNKALSAMTPEEPVEKDSAAVSAMTK